jgi:pseudomonalisin
MRFRTASVRRHMIAVVAGVSLLIVNNAAFAQRERAIRNPINESDVVRRQADVDPLARPEFDQGLADMNYRMDKMVLVLGLRPGAEKEVDALIEQQHDPESPAFHQWLTPDEFETRFGMSDDDLNAVTGWLTSHGFTLDEVGKDRRWVNFSGNAQQVERAFHTEMHKYLVNGEIHYANATPPAIPRALAGAVIGVVSLHDFRPQANASFLTPSGFALAPADFAKIYNVQPLYDAGIKGTGISIAIAGAYKLGVSDVSDAHFFWSQYLPLPVGPNPCVFTGSCGPTLKTIPVPGYADSLFLPTSNCVDPYPYSYLQTQPCLDKVEAMTDVQLAGAVARNATIDYVYAPHTSAIDGMTIAAQYIVQNKTAPIVSISYSKCEAASSTFAKFYNDLWQTAVLKGMTVFVSSGDSGSAGCNLPTDPWATEGLNPQLPKSGVNAICSTPYSICVGGTQFAYDATDSVTYWNVFDRQQAKSYIPEHAWNESAYGDLPYTTGLWATGGGPSILYPEPIFQTGTLRYVLVGGVVKSTIVPTPGMPAGGIRRVPDVSLNASFHTPYLMYLNGTLTGAVGTSAAAPSFAGLMALVEQKNGQWLGNANYNLYGLAIRQFTGVAAPPVFHDVTAGNNSELYLLGPIGGEHYGFLAGPGYDQATGLGSVDATQLVNGWPRSLNAHW